MCAWAGGVRADGAVPTDLECVMPSRWLVPEAGAGEAAVEDVGAVLEPAWAAPDGGDQVVGVGEGAVGRSSCARRAGRPGRVGRTAGGELLTTPKRPGRARRRTRRRSRRPPGAGPGSSPAADRTPLLRAGAPPGMRGPADSLAHLGADVTEAAASLVARGRSEVLKRGSPMKHPETRPGRFHRRGAARTVSAAAAGGGPPPRAGRR